MRTYVKLIKCQLFGNGDCDVMISVASVTCCIIVPDTKYVLKKLESVVLVEEKARGRTSNRLKFH